MNKRILFSLIALVQSTPLFAHTLTVVCPHTSIPFTVELARTPEEQATGLMFRHKMDEDAGMIFLYPTPGPIAMWMKNTPLSLDMVFANKEGSILAIYENTTPYSLATIGPVQETSHVLEINSGIVKKHGITNACRLKLNPEMPER